MSTKASTTRFGACVSHSAKSMVMGTLLESCYLIVDSKIRSVVTFVRERVRFYVRYSYLSALCCYRFHILITRDTGVPNTKNTIIYTV